MFFCTAWLVAASVWSAAGVVLYWGVLDRKPPVSISSGTGVFSATTYRLQLAMTSTRNRWCKGVRHSYLEDGFKQVLPDVALPANVYEVGKDRPGSQFIAYPDPIEVDPRIKDGFDYHATLEYQCNPLQKIWPIVVHVPVVHVPQSEWVR